MSEKMKLYIELEQSISGIVTRLIFEPNINRTLNTILCDVFFTTHSLYVKDKKLSGIFHKEETSINTVDDKTELINKVVIDTSLYNIIHTIMVEYMKYRIITDSGLFEDFLTYTSYKDSVYVENASIMSELHTKIGLGPFSTSSFNELCNASTELSDEEREIADYIAKKLDENKNRIENMLEILGIEFDQDLSSHIIKILLTEMCDKIVINLINEVVADIHYKGAMHTLSIVSEATDKAEFKMLMDILGENSKIIGSLGRAKTQEDYNKLYRDVEKAFELSKKRYGVMLTGRSFDCFIKISSKIHATLAPMLAQTLQR